MLGITKHTETEERDTMTNAEHETENSKKVLHARRESNERERDQPRASLPPFREASFLRESVGQSDTDFRAASAPSAARE